MTELERIKYIEERITLEGLLTGVDLGSLPPGESEKLKSAVLDLYRLGHASGFKAGADHAMNAVAAAIPQFRYIFQLQWLKRWLSARMREYLQDIPKSLRSIRATVFGSQRPRRFPTEVLSGNWAFRRRLR
jgi:hypothetical protein